MAKKLKPAPYLEYALRSLDRDLRKLSREEKLESLRKYKLGLDYSFWNNYGNKFPKPQEAFEVYHEHYFSKANYVGFQFGPLEVDSAREFLLSEIEKRKRKYSKPSFWENLRKYLKR